MFEEPKNLDELLDGPLRDMPGHGHYHLDENKEPVKSKTLREWGMNFEKDPHESGRVVKQERIGPYRVSTVFLMIDHAWSQFGQIPVPVLWETMVFFDMDGELPHDRTLCSGSREQAEAMHEEVAARCRALAASRDPAREWLGRCLSVGAVHVIIAFHTCMDTVRALARKLKP